MDTNNSAEFYKEQKEVIKRSLSSSGSIPSKALSVDEYYKLLSLYFQLEEKEHFAAEKQKAADYLTNMQ